MSRLNELIRELCPNGVEFKKLGDVCYILDNKRKPISKSKRNFGNYPYYGANGIQDYIDDFLFDGTFLLIGEDGSVINKNNSPVLNWATGKIWVNNHAHVLSEMREIMLLRFLYFTLSETNISDIVRGTPPKLNQENLRNIKLPVPSLDVQNEIVRILDTFTSHTAELQAELQARKEQYEYYRNKLLTFDKDDKNVKWMKLGELCEIYTGGEPPKCTIKGNFKDEEHPYPIWANGKDIYGYSSTYKINKDAVVISSIGANTGTVYYRKAYFTPIIRLKVLVPKDKTILSKYLYYYLSTISIVVKSSSVPNINANEVKKMQVPILPICVQQRIVSILDKFEALVNDLTEGIPAEIAAVQEQYEYYRNKLLTFKQRA